MKKYMLIVEDDPSVVQFFESVLPEEQYNIFSVETAEEAIELLQGIDFHIVILDYRLRGRKNGLDVLRQCRNLSTATIYSNTGSPDHADKMKKLGCDFHLMKNNQTIQETFNIPPEKVNISRKSYTTKALKEFYRQH